MIIMVNMRMVVMMINAKSIKTSIIYYYQSQASCEPEKFSGLLGSSVQKFRNRLWMGIPKGNTGNGAMWDFTEGELVSVVWRILSAIVGILLVDLALLSW